MKPISEFRTNGALIQEQYTKLDTAVKTAASAAIKGRRIIPTVGPFGFGTEALAYDTLTQMSPAQISYAWKVDANQDLVNISRTTVPVPTIIKSYRINARSLAASRTYGTPLDTQNAKSAAYQVALIEDDLIFNGYKPDGVNYEIKGLYQAAGNSFTSANDFATVANIPIAINGAIALAIEDNIDGPYNFGMNSAQYTQTNNLIADGGGKSWRSWIEETVGGQVYWTNAITAGTGLLSAAGDKGFFDLALGVDLRTETEELGLDQGHDLFGVVYETIVPRVYEANALVSLTQI